ncbi:hypothetical protein B0H19DRAFT_1112499 [Mycena capillaripes]|nr:hypothetical protein B0H19DRAFT_1112499 [Mycena capillaripes]
MQNLGSTVPLVSASARVPDAQVHIVLLEICVGDILPILAFVPDGFSCTCPGAWNYSLHISCPVLDPKLVRDRSLSLLPAASLLPQLFVVKFELVIEHCDIHAAAIILQWWQQVPSVVGPVEQRIGVDWPVLVQYVSTACVFLSFSLSAARLTSRASVKFTGSLHRNTDIGDVGEVNWIFVGECSLKQERLRPHLRGGFGKKWSQGARLLHFVERG